ncbi:MAG TPA: ribosome recycling factor [Porphyromonadaceae bacterium]|nr:ribosome recycling factor [Porphyromonadaceae bacterium]
MATEVKDIISQAEEKMKVACEHLEEALSRIRAGKANPKILEGIYVEYYGSNTPLSGVASITTPDAKSILIQPWEKKMLPIIEKAILASNVGITPENNGENIRLGIPPLTTERRTQLVKQAKTEAENAKISVRNARRDAVELLKKAVKEGMPEDVSKDGENVAQKTHDKFMKQVDSIFSSKEKEIMTV